MTGILLIEDDEVSRAYLAEALALLAREVKSCTLLGQAHDLLRDGAFDLIVSDLNLPDGDLFDALAGFARHAPVLALSSGLDRATRDRLLAAGAAEAMAKPMPMADLHAAVTRLCGLAEAAPLWNSAKALRVLAGNPQAVTNLKALFRAELPTLRASIRQALAEDDAAALKDILHKLKASTGFLGAERLQAECHALERAPTAHSLACFERVCDETLDAM